MKTLIEEAITLLKIETKYHNLYANLSCYMSFASDASCSKTLVMFPNYEDVN